MSLSDLYSASPKPWCNINVNELSSTSSSSAPVVTDPISLLLSDFTDQSRSWSLRLNGIADNVPTTFYTLTIPNANCSFAIELFSISSLSAPSGSVGTGASVLPLQSLAVIRKKGAAAVKNPSLVAGYVVPAGGATFVSSSYTYTLSGGLAVNNILTLAISNDIVAPATASDVFVNLKLTVINAEGTDADLA